MAAATSSAPATRIPPETWRTTIVIAFGAFLSGLDASIVNIGLESITSDLAIPLSQGHWVTTGYLLAMAVSLPAAGWLGRRFGAGRIWLWALFWFTVFSLACALTSSFGGLVAARIAQGAAGGVLVPAGQTVIGQVVGANRLGRVMATLGLVVTLAPALGPVAGGAILQQAAWPWLFLVNLPIGVVALGLGLRLVPRGTQDERERFDLVGLLMLSVGMPLLLYGLTDIGDHSRVTRDGGGAALAGLVALAAYVRHQRGSTRPVLRLALLRSASFRLAVAAVSLNGVALLGTALLLPLWLQVGHGLGPARAGTLLVALGAGTAVTLPVVGQVVDRWGSGPTAVLGAAATGTASTAFVLLGESDSVWVVTGMLFGFGAALAFASVPLTVAAYTSVRQEDLPDATTQVNIAHRFGGAAGAALFSIVLSHALDTGQGDPFVNTFLVLTGFSLLGLVTTLRLRRSLGR